MPILKRLLTKKRMILQFRFPPKIFFCTICNSYSLLIRIDFSKRIGTRCIKCRSTAIHRGMVNFLRTIFEQKLTNLRKNIYEMSAHGALYDFFKKNKEKLNYNFYFSEYLDDWDSGKVSNGIRCEDIENLTFEDNLFDLITSTEIMEHVENDIKGYQEIYRTLKEGGYYIFTVPLLVTNKKTIIRAKRKDDGSINNFLEPEYHGDPFRGDKGVFTWRNYGTDIVDLLKFVGFYAEIKEIYLNEINDYIPIIVAKK